MVNKLWYRYNESVRRRDNTETMQYCSSKHSWVSASTDTVYPLESKHQLCCVMRRQWNDNECEKGKFVWSESRNVSWTLKKVVFLNKKKRITKLEKTNTTSHMSIWRSICFEPLLFPVTWLLDQYYWGINSMATQFIRVWTGLGSLFKKLTSSGLLRFIVN